MMPTKQGRWMLALFILALMAFAVWLTVLDAQAQAPVVDATPTPTVSYVPTPYAGPTPILTQTMIIDCGFGTQELVGGWVKVSDYYAGTGRPWRCVIERPTWYGRMTTMRRVVFDMMGTGPMNADGTVSVTLEQLDELITLIDEGQRAAREER